MSNIRINSNLEARNGEEKTVKKFLCFDGFVLYTRYMLESDEDRLFLEHIKNSNKQMRKKQATPGEGLYGRHRCLE